MTKFRSLKLLAFLALGMLAGSGLTQGRAAAGATPLSLKVCADFLARLGQKPKELEFVSCVKAESGGWPVLQADYRVRGADVRDVEAHFVKTARMPKLSFACCGWETGAGYGRYKADSLEYKVTMHSDETLVKKRSAWHSVAYFYVTTVLFIDGP